MTNGVSFLFQSEWRSKFLALNSNFLFLFFFLGDQIDHNQLEGGPNTLFSNLTRIWEPLKLNLTSDFANGGYFRQDINSKLSVFSLNSMYFFNSNEQIKDCDHEKSPGAIQLEWIEFQLKSARREGRKVLISQHVPPLGSDGE